MRHAPESGRVVSFDGRTVRRFLPAVNRVDAATGRPASPLQW
jgi:hypothetical protein